MRGKTPAPLAYAIMYRRDDRFAVPPLVTAATEGGIICGMNQVYDAARLPLVHPELTARLGRILPAARVEAAALPDVPELALYLINADFRSDLLTPEETQAVLEYPAYWAFCWASGQALARYLLDNPSLVKDRYVIDFGTGSGVAAVAAAKAGARGVIACDIDPDALLAARCNAQLNGVQIELAADFDALPPSADLIIAADVLYDRANLAWLPRLRQRAQRVLIADSRVKNFRYPGYRRLFCTSSSTWPNLDEFDEFRTVNVYLGRSARD